MCGGALVVAAMAALNTGTRRPRPGHRGHPGATHLDRRRLHIALACLLLPSGALGDRYGRRGLLVIGTAAVRAGVGVADPAGQPTQIIAPARSRASAQRSSCRTTLRFSPPVSLRRNDPGPSASGRASQDRGHRRTHRIGPTARKGPGHAIFIGLAGVSAVLFALAVHHPVLAGRAPVDVRHPRRGAERRGDRALRARHHRGAGAGLARPLVLAAIVGGLAAGALFASSRPAPNTPARLRLFGNSRSASARCRS